jgi:hypothetical protein
LFSLSSSHSFAGQSAGLLHLLGKLSFVELIVLVDWAHLAAGL